MLRKLVVIGVASVLWLIVLIERLPDSITQHNQIGIDVSWVVGLPAAFHQHYIAGRDFYFAYGPLAQVIAWTGARLHSPWSPIDSLPLILLAFGCFSIVLLGLILALITDIDATACLWIYAGITALNLFSEPTSFRVLILMLAATCTYRALKSTSSNSMLKWTTATGCIAIIGQLITIELGLYSLVAAASAIAIHCLRKARSRDILPCYAVLAAVYGLGNLGISIAFVLSSRGHGLFDYQRYSLELIRGFNYTSGIPWALGGISSAVLVTVVVFTILSASWLISKTEHSALAISLITVALITLKSAVTRSDIGHITQSVSPFVFTFLVFGFLFFRENHTRYRFGIPWAVIFIALFVVWPWSSRSALADLRNAAKNPPLSKIAKLRTTIADPAQLLPPELQFLSVQSQRPLLPFPHEVDIPVTLKSPIVSPVFQSFQAGVTSLQQFYVREIENLGNNLDVIYATDSSLDGVQSISRVPAIFEYLYRNFRLAVDNEAGGCRFCLLTRNPIPAAMKTQIVALQTTNTTAGLQMRSHTPQTCSLLKLNMQIDYSVARFFGHTTPVDMRVYRAEGAVMQTRLVPVEVNQPFSTYVSLIPPDQFYTVFQHHSVPQLSWDELRMDSHSVDWAGVTPSSIRIAEIECVTF